MKVIKIGLMGFGVVGRGVYEMLSLNRQVIRRKTGVALEIGRILVRDVARATADGAPVELLTTQAADILDDDSIDIVVEVLGGVTPASDWMMAAMRAGKHVVTANKAAVAANFAALVATSKAGHVMFRFEASVAGGIPILDALQAPLTSDDIEEVTGIVNGTTNFVLTQMAGGLSYDAALQLAQARGFAESDPTADVEGVDAANKLAILTALAFGQVLRVDEIPTVGIAGVTAADMAYAASLGYKIKLVATAKKQGHELSATVQPTMVPEGQLLATVNNEFNAIFVRGNAVGDLLFYGKGAGALPTASAVTGDIIEIANAIDKQAAFDLYVNQIPSQALDYVGEGVHAYFVALTVADAAGVLGRVATVFGGQGVSVATMRQLRADATGQASLIFVLHEVARSRLDAALAELTTQGLALRVTSVMRVLLAGD